MTDEKKNPQPHLINNIPYCDDNIHGSHCNLFDGARCRILGHKPHSICKPAVAEIVKRHDEMVDLLQQCDGAYKRGFEAGHLQTIEDLKNELCLKGFKEND